MKGFIVGDYKFEKPRIGKGAFSNIYKGKNLIKGIRYEGVRVIGEPQKYAEKYYNDGFDEIIYIDSVASLYQRNNIFSIVLKAANEIFIPLKVQLIPLFAQKHSKIQ